MTSFKFSIEKAKNLSDLEDNVQRALDFYEDAVSVSVQIMQDLVEGHLVAIILADMEDENRF